MIIFLGGGEKDSLSVQYAVHLIEIRANENYLSKMVKHQKKRIRYVLIFHFFLTS